MGPCQTQLFNNEIATNRTTLAATVKYSLSQKLPATLDNIRANNSESAINNIFPTRQEENKLEQARRILGEIAVSMSDEELESQILKFQLLIDSWMDKYEKQLFEGKTLNQLLKEG